MKQTHEQTEADILAECLDDVWPTHNTAFARLLTVLYKLFDGDLEAMFILLVLSLQSSGPDWNQALQGKSTKVRLMRPTNTQSIADSSGVPRETVRRKLLEMQKKGWVHRDDDGRWLPTSAAAVDLHEGTLATFDYLRIMLKLGNDFQSLKQSRNSPHEPGK